MTLLRKTAGPTSPDVDSLVDALQTSHAEDQAALKNLQDETRLPEAIVDAFFEVLCNCLAALPRDKAIDQACRQFTRQLPRPRTSVDEPWETMVSLDALKRHGFYPDDENPGTTTPAPRQFRMARRLGTTITGDQLSLWATRPVSGTADEVRDRLGLFRVGTAGTTIYRVRLQVTTTRDAWIPTALDAGTYPAWRRPPTHHTAPWGMTRHLQTDEPTEPEILLLADTEDSLLADLVGTTTTAPPNDFLSIRLR
jgi:hypothetical protein